MPAANLAEPGWVVRHGQAVWRSTPKAPEIAGDLVLAMHPDGRTLVQFTKTPLPFLIAQTTGNAWRIEFVSKNKTVSGRGEPPTRLGWLHLARCFAGKTPPKGWRFRESGDGSWRLENGNTGERLEGYLIR